VIKKNKEYRDAAKSIQVLLILHLNCLKLRNLKITDFDLYLTG
jgi:hypothetical protein